MSENAAQSSTKKLHFLLIDDDKQIGECLSMIVAITGHESSYFSNPLQALTAFQTHPDTYHGIFTDLRMPEMHGDELIARIRELDTQIPIVIVTGTIVTISEKNLQALHIPKVIQKPFDLHEIETMIRFFEERTIFGQQYGTLLKEVHTPFPQKKFF